MKTLIVYASKTGTTKKCATYLYDKIKKDKEAVLLDLSKNAEDVSIYDTVIIGSPIRAGKIQKSVKNFMEKYQNILKDKDLYIFFCCASDETFAKYITDNIPQMLIDSAK